jgi:hypothetical protein
MKRRLERNLRGDNENQTQQPIPQAPLSPGGIKTQVDSLDFETFVNNHKFDENFFGHPVDKPIMSDTQGNQGKTFKLPPPPSKTIMSLDSYTYPTTNTTGSDISNQVSWNSRTFSNHGLKTGSSPSTGTLITMMEPGDLFPCDSSVKLDSNNNGSFCQNVSSYSTFQRM